MLRRHPLLLAVLLAGFFWPATLAAQSSRIDFLALDSSPADTDQIPIMKSGETRAKKTTRADLRSGLISSSTNQTPNFVFAGPATGVILLSPTFRALVGLDLPLALSGTRGGVQLSGDFGGADGSAPTVVGAHFAVGTSTTTYTMAAGNTYVECDATAAGYTINLPSAATVGVAGKLYLIKKTDSSANVCTVDANGSQTIDGALTYTIGGQYQGVGLISDGSNWKVGFVTLGNAPAPCSPGNYARGGDKFGAAIGCTAAGTGTVSAVTCGSGLTGGTFTTTGTCALANPSSSTLGGIQSLASAASKWINAISTSGVPSATQPGFADIANSASCAQLPAFTGSVTTSAGSCATSIASGQTITNPTFAGHTKASGSLPAITCTGIGSTGSSAMEAGSTDDASTWTMTTGGTGITATGTCTVTFNAGYSTNFPVCIVQLMGGTASWNTTALAPQITTESLTAPQVSWNNSTTLSAGSYKLSMRCIAK